ncbi:unnamed protein product [Oppiella nova]|uniref:TerD domain-containing protein n=1 Tax=Oppiella nova TaxID=334625 RepID=A0A7R9L7T4_9ACAR|nr:unnamed protein product [Oppiella nova]CAG2156661.1 unnamed protein product [Oppiella nova]
MAISLNKGGNLSLSKTDPSLNQFVVNTISFSITKHVHLKVLLNIQVITVQVRVMVMMKQFALISHKYLQMFKKLQLQSPFMKVKVAVKILVKFKMQTAMIFGELYRHNGEWKFRAVGQGYAGGLSAMCQQFGISI